MSTISPTITRELGELADAQGVACIDAPVSGGPPGAAAGPLSIIVGGPADVYEACLPILKVLGSEIAHMGDLGAGQVTKACNQVMVAAKIAGVAEALVLGTKAGIDPAKLRGVLLGGYAQSRILDVHGERMIGHHFEPGFFAKLHDKDRHIVLDMARRLGAAAPVSALAAQMLNALVARGDGELDNSAIVKVYEARRTWRSRELCAG
jgi:2-hydroxy-3-oxopropionate reductase